MLTAFLVIAILVLLIVAHELDIFCSKDLSRSCEEFGVGYPPRAITFGKIGETEYTLNWIPFGGFVRLFGDIGEEQHGRGSFVDAHRGVQAAILFAGVAANVIAAWVLFAVALHIGVPQIVDAPLLNQPARLIVVNIIPASPADAAGIQPGDEIIDITAHTGEKLKTLLPSTVVDFVKIRGGKSISVSYIHAGVTQSASIIPANAVLPNAGGQPALGIALALVANKSLPWNEAVVAAFRETQSAFKTVAAGLWGLVQSASRGALDISQIVGPVGIVSYVGQASQNGFGTVLILAAMISVNLAIINLIPIPALDGGRLAILIVEGILRRNASRLALQILNALGIALVITLMFVVTYNDIVRLAS